MTIENIIDELDIILIKNQNNDDAIAMRQYMKNKFFYLGIKKPKRDNLSQVFFQKVKLLNNSDYYNLIELLWEKEYREYNYIALELLKKIQKKFTPEYIFLLEKLAYSNPWWDTIDMLAVITGNYFKIHKDKKLDYLEKWIFEDNFWINRFALLHQLKYKENTDWDLLEKHISLLLPNKEFFIQKAIGWILRENSKINFSRVNSVIEKYNIGGLAKKEAQKLIYK